MKNFNAVDIQQLDELLDSFPNCYRHPMYRPAYVEVMAQYSEGAFPKFFLYEEDEYVFYHPYLSHETQVNNQQVLDIESAYGFGGPIVNTADKAFISRAQQAYVKYCEENNICVEFLRFNPCLRNHDFYQGTVVNNRKVAVVDLTLESVTDQIQRRTRSAIRKSKREGVEISWSKEADDIKSFIDLYYLSMSRLSADSFYFFKKEVLAQLVKLPHCHLAIAKYNGEVIAAATFFVDGDFMEYHLSANNGVGQQLNATKAIIAEAMNLGQSLNAKYLHLGGGNSTDDSDPLLKFKSLFTKTFKHYFIGHQIFQPQFYNHLKETMLNSSDGINNAENISNRIIFYR